MIRKKIKDGEPVQVKLTRREGGLLKEHLLSDPSLIDRLNLAPLEGGSLEVLCSLCDLHLLLDDISAVSNQVRSPRLQEELDILYERLEMVTQSYEEVEPF